MSTRQDILTPVGRLVAGSLYKGSDKDAEGKPRTIKSGPNAGQATVQYFFAVAIPKKGEQHWANTEWGAKIWAAGHAAFPVHAQTPHFAWKVEDGDSAIPNRKNRKPCDNEGWKGCWVLKFASGFPPKIYNADGTQQITEPDAVKPGYFVQVFGSVDGNGSQQQPGVFLNHSMVALAAYGPEINLGADASAVGFGGAGAALPPGASAVPLSAGFNPAPAAPGLPPAPTATPPAPMAPAPSLPAVPTPVSAHPGFLAPAAAPVAPGVPLAPMAVPLAPMAVPLAPMAVPLAPPPAPAAPADPPARVMLPAAGGTSYEVYRQAGWTDAQLIANGLMQP